MRDVAFWFVGAASGLVITATIWSMTLTQPDTAYTSPIIGHVVETERGNTAICYIYDDRIFLGCEDQ